MMTELEKYTQILVESKYAENSVEDNAIVLVRYSELQLYPENVNPFYNGDDTHKECLSRRQAHAIINWIIKYHLDVWSQSAYLNKDMANFDIYKFSEQRIKWCIEELIK